MNYQNNKIYNYTLSLLSRRDYSKHKLREKLLQKGYCQEDIEAVIEQTSSEGLLNEKRFINSKIRLLAKRNYSKSYIQKYLNNQRIPCHKDDIDSLFIDENTSEESQLELLVEKKLRNLKTLPDTPEEIYRLKNKLISHLISKGHNFQKIQSVISKRFSKI